VTDSIEFRGFVTGTTANPDSGGYRPETRHVFGQDGNAIGESCGLNVVNHLS
jgi:hypothetical protein